jgi:hypothetical protein
VILEILLESGRCGRILEDDGHFNLSRHVVCGRPHFALIVLFQLSARKARQAVMAGGPMSRGGLSNDPKAETDETAVPVNTDLLGGDRLIFKADGAAGVLVLVCRAGPSDF